MFWQTLINRKLFWCQVVYAFVADKNEVEDIVQTAYAKFLKVNRQFPTKNHAVKYFRKVLETCIADHHRRLYRELRSREYLVAEYPAIYEETTPEKVLSEQQSEEHKKFLASMAKERLQGLSPLQQHVIHQVILGNLTTAEYGRIHGVPKSTVHSRLVEGITLLRVAMEEVE